MIDELDIKHLLIGSTVQAKLMRINLDGVLEQSFTVHRDLISIAGDDSRIQERADHAFQIGKSIGQRASGRVDLRPARARVRIA